MAIKIGIVGYGNLGKAVEKLIKADTRFELVGIFSRRSNVISSLKTPVYARANIDDFIGKIDLLIIATGSAKEMLTDAPTLAKNFNILNTFETHNKILSQYKLLSKIAKNSGTLALICFGWDPGLFSIMRAILALFLNVSPHCFYGPGISLGHSQILKNVNGVSDAISITKPNPTALKCAKRNKPNNLNNNNRVVFATLNPHANADNVKAQINNIPNYFKGENVKINFVTPAKLKAKKITRHSGQIVACNNFISIEFKLKTQSNALLTATIAKNVALNFKKLKAKFYSGCITPLHLCPLDLAGNINEAIKEYC